MVKTMHSPWEDLRICDMHHESSELLISWPPEANHLVAGTAMNFLKSDNGDSIVKKLRKGYYWHRKPTSNGYA